MGSNWYSKSYLGKSFDKFLSSDMSTTDFMQLEQVLQQVSEQLRMREVFIKNGFLNKTGKTHTKTSVVRET